MMQATNSGFAISISGHAHALAAPSASSPRQAARRATTSGASLSFAAHQRTDSNASLASLIFDFETDEAGLEPSSSGSREVKARLPAGLQSFVDLACGQPLQAQLWCSALEARTQTLAEQQQQQANGEDSKSSSLEAEEQQLPGTCGGEVADERRRADQEHDQEQLQQLLSRVAISSTAAKANTVSSHPVGAVPLWHAPSAPMTIAASVASRSSSGGSGATTTAAAMDDSSIAAQAWLTHQNNTNNHSRGGLPALSLRSVGSARLGNGSSSASAGGGVSKGKGAFAAAASKPIGIAGAASTAAAGDDDDQAVDIRRFAQHLAELGPHCVWVRSGLYTCPPESGMGTLKHKFVVVSMPGDSSDGQPTYLVVDPNWKAHFQVAGKGPEAEHYRKLLALLPSVFVGTADQLAALTTLLCKEMEKVFLARGVPLPPWRTPRVMQGRWLVNKVLEDELVPATPPCTPCQNGLVLPSGRTVSGELRERLPQLAQV